MNKWLKIGLAVLLVIAVACGGYVYHRFRQLTDVPDTSTVDLTVTEGIVSADEERRIIEQHKIEAIEKVVIIREQVRSEVLALSPDELAAFALNEIGVFRSGSAGRDPSASPPGLDDVE